MKRERISCASVKLADLNHKINRKAGLLKQYDFWRYQWRKEDNWLLEDEYAGRMAAIEDAFNETLSTPVGGYVRRYI